MAIKLKMKYINGSVTGLPQLLSYFNQATRTTYGM